MNKRKLLAALLSVFVTGSSALCGVAQAEEKQEKNVDIMFTHDTHSHLNSFSTIENGKSTEAGGFSRLKTLINEQKEKNPDTLILDAGDYSMGTLVQVVYATQSAELRMLGELGCEVTTLGNHEFDYRSEGLADSLLAAKKSADPIPALVLCNVDWESMEEKGLTQEQQLLKDAFESYGMKDYVMVQKGDTRIAVLGVFGEDSLACAPTCVLEFEDVEKAAAETVAEIKEKEEADMIVCVSHCGTSDEIKYSEDELLAKAVPEIDLIVSGHSHTVLEESIVYGDTYIVSCGEYGKNLGSLSMTQKQDGRWEMQSYGLIPVSTDIEPDDTTQKKADAFIEAVDEEYLTYFGYTSDQVIVENDVEFCTVKDLGEKHEEGNLGNIIADAYHYAVEDMDPEGDPVDLAVCPSGTVRETYAMGEITVQDIFNSFSLGIGKDGIPGYPLLSVYLTGKELKIVAEIDASISDIMKYARLYNCGMYFTYNPNRMILNKVTDCYLVDDGERVDIRDDQLYRVVTDLYTGQMLGTVTDLSYGLLSVVPKDKDGVPYEEISDAILEFDGKELKAWDAIVRYMKSFEDVDGNGIPDVPAFYGEIQGRKVADNSKNILELVKKPNRFTFLLLGVLILAVLLLWAVIHFVRKGIHKIKKISGRREKIRDSQR